MEESLIVYRLDQSNIFKNFTREPVLTYYASDIFSEFGFSSFSEFQDSLQKAFTILNSAKIPLKNHIRLVFRDQNNQIFQDWKLSALACHLLKINGALENRNVVEYQIKMYSLFQD